MHKKSRTVVCKQPYGIYGYVKVRCLLETVLQRRSPDRLGWKYRTVLDKGRKGKVSRTVVSEVEISHLKPVRDDMQEARMVLQNIVDITWGG